MRRLDISDQDIANLAALAHAEAGIIATRAKTPEDRARAYNSVVDTIINRAAAGGWYGKDVTSVMNRPSQFTPVTSAGSVQRLPRAPGAVESIIREHVRNRASGGPSSVGGATHFYNDAIAAPAWGKQLAGRTQVGGGDSRHVFGTLARDPKPGTYEIAYSGKASAHTPGAPDADQPSPSPAPGAGAAAASSKVPSALQEFERLLKGRDDTEQATTQEQQPVLPGMGAAPGIAGEAASGSTAKALIEALVEAGGKGRTWKEIAARNREKAQRLTR